MNERLKEIRAYYGLNMRDFAAKLGMSHSTICLYESGERPINDRIIIAICSVFTDISEEWFRTGEGEMLKPQDRNAEIAAIAAKMYKGSDKIRTKWTEMIWDMSSEDLEFLNDLICKMADTIRNENRTE